MGRLPRAALPLRMAADPDKPTLSERFTRAVIKADSRPERPVDEGPQTVEELEEAVARMPTTQERLIGLAAAPAGRGRRHPRGQQPTARRPASQPSSVDSSLALALFALALIMLACAWFRKRLYLGIVCALYGLSIFNLHYWGFGVPFLLIGSWYLVRAYRLQQKLKLAKAEGATGSGGHGRHGPAGPSRTSATPRRSPDRPSRPSRPSRANRRRPTTDGHRSA